MFRVLSQYYDELVLSDHARDQWVLFTETHMKTGTILEIGSGTGEITLELAKNYYIVATDLSSSMLQQLKNKDKDHLVDHYQIMDMRKLSFNKKFDNIIAYCDTFNYLRSYQELKEVVEVCYKHLKPKGRLLFDLHSLDRITEFKRPYQEVGLLKNGEYSWFIESKGNRLCQKFIFSKNGKEEMDSFDQFVFDPSEVVAILEKQGFKVRVFTDFIKEGIQPGEKIFFVGEKE